MAGIEKKKKLKKRRHAGDDGKRKGLVPRRVPLFISSPSHRPLVCYTAVFSIVTQRSSRALRDDTKNDCSRLVVPPGAFFFSLPSLPKVQRGLCEGERAYPKRTYLQLHFNYKTKL